jgi:hypothetical protein
LSESNRLREPGLTKLNLKIGKTFVRNEGETTGVWVYRAAFLKSIARKGRNVLKALANDVDPLFQETRSAIGYQADSDQIRELLDRADPRVANLQKALASWATKYNKYNLTEPWLETEAIRTMADWDNFRHSLRELGLRVGFFERDTPMPRIKPSWAKPPVLSINVASDEQRRFDDPGWNPALESWDRFEMRIARKLKAYQVKQEKLIGKRGFVRFPTKREVEHFDWLALRVVHGLTPAQILKRRGQRQCTEDAIRKGIKTAARLVKLHLPKGKPGRKRIRK